MQTYKYEESQQMSPALPVAVALAGVRDVRRRSVSLFTSSIAVGLVVPMPTLPPVCSVISDPPPALLMTASGVADSLRAPK
jgi:hypothetical protein